MPFDNTHDLQTAQGDADRHDKSGGDFPDNSPEITKIAHLHAQHRFVHRFTLDPMLSEIRALRASVIRRWMDDCAQFDHETVEVLIRFGEAMDQALTEAVAFFGAKVDQSRGLLLGVLGHDIRTPLAAIRMSGQLLERTQGLGEQQSKAVQRIINSSDTMRTMADDLLDFTQTSLGTRLPITRAPCDLKAVCTEVVAELEALHPERKIHLECDGDLTGKWDAGRVGQMISNLVRNAIQHGHQELAVTVTVKGCPNEATIECITKEGPFVPNRGGRFSSPCGRPRTWAATDTRVLQAWDWACTSHARLQSPMAARSTSFRQKRTAPLSPRGCIANDLLARAARNASLNGEA